MFKLLKNKEAVSQVLGFVLSLGLTAIVVISAGFLTSSYVDENTESAAQAEAENIANRVVNLLVNAYLIKEQYPDADYSATMDIPSKLVNHFDYTITVERDILIVKSNDGRIIATKDIYNINRKLNMYTKGSVGGGVEELTVYCYKTDYLYRFDFGTEDSTTVPGYTKITERAYNPNDPFFNDWDPDYSNWKYRTPITINNPGGGLFEFQVLIEFTDTNFDHSLVNSDGSDIRFTDELGDEDNPLNYWIEQWYSYDTHTSRIWVNIPILSAGNMDIYMYYGNPSASAISDGGDNTFLFFDDFNQITNEIDYTSWQKYIGLPSSDVYIRDYMLVLENTVALNSKVGFSPPYIIETKTKAISTGGTGKIESGLFARNDETADEQNYMETASILSSGSFSVTSNNLAVQEWNGVGWDTQSVSSSGMAADTWYRLRHDIEDAGNGHIYRYFYDNYEADGDGSYTTSIIGQYFGLCITDIQSPSDLKTYFDWIYVRKYANPMPTVSTIGGTQSQDFYWSDNTGLGSSERSGLGSDLELGKDFVYSTSPDIFEFVIGGLDPNLPYSVTVTIGDIVDGEPIVDRLVDYIDIQADAIPAYWYPSVYCTDEEPFRTVAFLNMKPNADNTIRIQLVDTDDDGDPVTVPIDLYWALCSLTIEQGDRAFILEGAIS